MFYKLTYPWESISSIFKNKGTAQHSKNLWCFQIMNEGTDRISNASTGEFFPTKKLKDKKLTWRRFVNKQLQSKYKQLYDQLNCLLYLKSKNFSLLRKWRIKQEKKLRLKNNENLLLYMRW